MERKKKAAWGVGQGDWDIVKSGAWLSKEAVETSEDRLRQAIASRDKLNQARQARSKHIAADRTVEQS